MKKTLVKTVKIKTLRIGTAINLDNKDWYIQDIQHIGYQSKLVLSRVHYENQKTP